MSLALLTEAHGAITELLTRVASFWDDADAQINTRRDAYDQLAADLRATVAAEMGFAALIDPDAVDPDQVNGGTFTSISTAIGAAPPGASVMLTLADGKTHALGTVEMRARKVTLTGTDNANRPTLQVSVSSNATHNHVRGFLWSPGASLLLQKLNIEIADKADPALPWSAFTTIMRHSQAGAWNAALRDVSLTGPDGTGLVSAHSASAVSLSLYSVSFDGPVYAVIGGGNAVASISRQAVSFLNGAQLTDGGTLGTDLLNN